MIDFFVSIYDDIQNGKKVALKIENKEYSFDTTEGTFSAQGISAYYPFIILPTLEEELDNLEDWGYDVEKMAKVLSLYTPKYEYFEILEKRIIRVNSYDYGIEFLL